MMQRFHRDDFFNEIGRALDQAWAHSELGMNKDAVEKCEKLVQANPNDPNLCVSLGAFYMKNGDIDKAIGWYQVLMKRFPGQSYLYVNLGYIYEKYKKRNDMALVCYEKASEFNPSDVWVLNNIGVMMKKEGRRQESLAYFKKAYQVCDQNDIKTCSHVLHNLAWAHYLSKEYSTSLEIYTYLADNYPEKSSVFSDSGCIRFKMGEYRMALELFDKALMLEPDNRHYIRQSDLARKKLSSKSW